MFSLGSAHSGQGLQRESSGLRARATKDENIGDEFRYRDTFPDIGPDIGKGARRAPDEFRYRDTFPDIGPDIGKGAPISELPILKP